MLSRLCRMIRGVWKDWGRTTTTYRVVDKADLIRQMRAAQRKTIFVAPLKEGD